MNKKDLKKFEDKLLSERARLTGNIRTIEDASRHDLGRDNSSDLSSYAESGTDNFELETSLNIASGASDWLGNVEDALKRLQAGTYGVCEMCHQEIPMKRLEVFPSARHCVACQDKLERKRRNNAGML